MGCSSESAYHILPDRLHQVLSDLRITPETVIVDPTMA